MPEPLKDAFKAPLGRVPGASSQQSSTTAQSSREYIAAWSAYLRDKVKQQELKERVASRSESESEAAAIVRRQEELWKEAGELEMHIKSLQQLRLHQEVLETLGAGDDATGSRFDLTELTGMLTEILNKLQATSRPLSVQKTTPVDQEALRSKLGDLSEGHHMLRLQLLLDTCRDQVRLRKALKATMEELVR